MWSSPCAPISRGVQKLSTKRVLPLMRRCLIGSTLNTEKEISSCPSFSYRPMVSTRSIHRVRLVQTLYIADAPELCWCTTCSSSTCSRAKSASAASRSARWEACSALRSALLFRPVLSIVWCVKWSLPMCSPNRLVVLFFFFVLPFFLEGCFLASSASSFSAHCVRRTHQSKSGPHGVKSEVWEVSCCCTKYVRWWTRTVLLGSRAAVNVIK